ncbi:hypothetical protein INT48_005033 [Thamnidium elegans]|uniref:Uncharacterized protein n=1 Tax=Thamnidium elegans TaxID=101142 RepID=A0A8H7VU45_9FUNG|nr:hypothetical protein INT48_005033 [Thamnidium elegans]
MDEENDDLIEFRDILDGYDYISSADDEIQDTDIEDVAPMVSNTGPVIISTDSTDTELEDALASPQFFLETGFIPSIDERNSEPDTELPEASLLPVTAPTASTSSATKCDSDMVEVNEVISSSLPVVPSVTHATIPIPVPSSRFSFKAPTRITVATSPAVPSSVNSSLKPLNLSSRLPPSLLSTSSDAPVTSSNTSNTRSDVQGRTSVSKEGDVGLDSAFSTEEDMEVSKNWNKNKRKQFKPVTPKRDKKRRIFYVIEIYNRK